MTGRFQQALDLLSFHEPIGQPREALQRLIRKAVFLDRGPEAAEGVSSLPGIDYRTVLRQKTLSEIALLITPAHATTIEPFRADTPIILGIWWKRCYLLDGRRRFCHRLRAGDYGPHPSFIVNFNRPCVS